MVAAQLTLAIMITSPAEAKGEVASLKLELVKLLPCGRWPKGVELTPDEKYAITTNFWDNTLTIVDMETLEVVKTVETDEDSPVEVIFTSPDEALITGGWQRDKIIIFDLEKLAIKKRFDTTKHKLSFPKIPAARPGSSEVWISFWASRTVGVFELPGFKLKGKVAVDKNPRGIAFTPDGKKAFVANFCEYCKHLGSIDAIDTGTRKRIGRIKGLKNPRHLVVTSDGKYLFASLLGEKGVIKVDTETLEIVARAEVGKYPKTIKLTPDEEVLFVANYKSDTVMALSTDDLKILETVKTGKNPSGLSVTKDGKYLWTTDWTSDKIRIYRIHRGP